MTPDTKEQETEVQSHAGEILIGDGNGRITSMKNLEKGRVQMIGVTTGLIFGEPYMCDARIDAQYRPDKSCHIEMEATVTMVMTQTVILLKALGSGMLFEDGSQAWRGVFCGSFPPGKLEVLNRCPIPFLISASPDHIFTLKMWEWKWD